MLCTPSIAARTLAAVPLPATAAFTCISSTVQNPLGSAQAGIGCRGAFSTGGLAVFSACVKACPSRAVAAELTASSASIRRLPSACIQLRYCWLQLTGITWVPAVWLVVAFELPAPWLACAVDAPAPFPAAPDV